MYLNFDTIKDLYEGVVQKWICGIFFILQHFMVKYSMINIIMSKMGSLQMIYCSNKELVVKQVLLKLEILN